MFGRRWNILSVDGIKIGIDLSWVLIAALLSWTLADGYFPHFYPKLTEANYWLMGLFGMLGLFICIVLHELGHALVAKHYKLPISQITLFIFGGVAEIKKEPKSPKVEFLMAIAGPLVSVLLVILTYLLAMAGENLGWPVEAIGVMSYLSSINAILVVFNLIPAFPLDGGRIFRALLWWWKKNLEWATKVAGAVGAAFGYFLIFMGVFFLITGNFVTGIWFAIIGLFLKNAAASSQTQFYVSEALHGEKVQKFMTKDPISVPPHITLKEFVEHYVYKSHHHLYPVAEKGEILVGYITLHEVKRLTPGEWGAVKVSDIMVPSSKFKTVTPRSSALDALRIMEETDSPTLMVTEDKHLVGILTAKNLFKQISLKLELEQSRKR